MIFKVLCSPPVLVTCYSPASNSSSSSSAYTNASDDINTPYNSKPSCSHHHLETHVTGIRTTSSQSYIIGHITIYWATVLWILKTYASTSSKTASCIASSNGGYYQLPSLSLRGYLPVIRRATLWWKPPRARPMWGVIPHVSDPKRRTTCTTVLKISPTPVCFPLTVPRSSTTYPTFSAPYWGFPPLWDSHHPRLWVLGQGTWTMTLR